MKLNPKDFWGIRKGIQVGDKVKFVGIEDNHIPPFIGNRIEDTSPIIHGSTALNKEYYSEGARVVFVFYDDDEKEDIYIVRYKDINGRYVQLGFLKKYLELMKKEE